MTLEQYFAGAEKYARRRVTKLTILRGKTKNIGKLEALIFSANSRLLAVRTEWLKSGMDY